MAILAMQGICKEFPGAKVLKDVDFQVWQNEIHALLGENGAGKSTLMKIITGIYAMDSGSIFYQGKPVHIRGPKQAEELGIVMIHQEFHLVPQLSVAENIFLGNEGEFTRWGTINWSSLTGAARRYLDQVGLKVHPKTPVAELSVGEKQLVEIAKALSKQAKLLIMDEPTAALTEAEKEKLFEIMQSLVKQGVSIVYISHRMEELFQICHRVTVLRDGEFIATRDMADTSVDQLVALMVGQGFHEVIDAQKDIKVVAKQPADFDRSKGMSVMENILQGQPEINAVFAHNDEMALGALQAIEASKKQMLIVGFDGGADAVKAVEEGKMAATVAQQPKLIGELGVQVAEKVKKGEKVEASIPADLKLITKQ